MPDSFPYFAGVLASYFLRVAAAYALCWVLSRLSPSPRRRFVLWLLFLLGAAGYWVAMLFPVSLPVAVSGAVQKLPVRQAALAPHTLLFPASWAPALALAARLTSAAYVLGVLLLLGNVIWQHVRLRRALRHALEPSPDLALLFDQMCRAFGIRRCRLLLLPQLSSPATAGWLHPSILLPEICEQFHDSSQLVDVLYHELVHVSRRDYLWAAVSDLVRCLLFFHPAVWRARQHMRVQRELACDVAVVSSRPEHCADYAQSLTRFARLRMLQPGRSLGVDFAASASILGIRVRAVLSYRPQSSGWGKAVRAGLSLLLVVSFGLLWPAFSVVAEFATAPTGPALVEPPAPITAQTAPHVRARKRRHAPGLQPPQFASTTPQLVVQPPAAKLPRAPNMIAMSSSEFGPQSNDFDEPPADAASDASQPNWAETQPLPHRRHISVANLVQQVATGLAEFGREQMSHEGRDHSGH